MIRAYLFLIVKIILCGILQFVILACGIRTGSRKELAIRPIPAYIVMDITVEYNQEMRLKLSRK